MSTRNTYRQLVESWNPLIEITGIDDFYNAGMRTHNVNIGTFRDCIKDKRQRCFGQKVVDSFYNNLRKQGKRHVTEKERERTGDYNRWIEREEECVMKIARIWEREKNEHPAFIPDYKERIMQIRKELQRTVKDMYELDENLGCVLVYYDGNSPIIVLADESNTENPETIPDFSDVMINIFRMMNSTRQLNRIDEESAGVDKSELAGAISLLKEREKMGYFYGIASILYENEESGDGDIPRSIFLNNNSFEIGERVPEEVYVDTIYGRLKRDSLSNVNRKVEKEVPISK